MATNETSLVMDVFSGVLQSPAVFGLRVLFYAVLPSESSFKNPEDVPKYVNQLLPFFVVMMVTEIVVLRLQGKKEVRPPDAMSSLVAGLFSLLPLVIFRNIEVSAYMWVYEHWSIASLPWDSGFTWFFAFLGVDMGYYWVHRFAHEVNFMWASHQVHHSSEDYNLTTALRQSLLQRYSSWVFYLPMAFFVPPSVFMVHIQFNLLYQFWIHTEVVSNIGPLEYILNTPSHHRVHHGRNRYCIDKNYAGVLIIWDRMFGTFESEGEEVVYGLVHPLKSWDTLYIQFCHWRYILQKAYSIEGIGNKISVFVKGPGWDPGKPRMGLIEDIPDIHAPQDRYDKPLPVFLTVYTFGHLGLALLGYATIEDYKPGLAAIAVLLLTLYILWTITNLGYLHEHKWYAPHSELARCVLYLVVDAYFCGGQAVCSNLLYVPRCLFLFSASLWAVSFLAPTLKAGKVD